jgi:hypothetical protein
MHAQATAVRAPRRTRTGSGHVALPSIDRFGYLPSGSNDASPMRI